VEAVCTSQTSVNIYLPTRQYIQEDFILAAVRTWNLTRFL